MFESPILVLPRASLLAVGHPSFEKQSQRRSVQSLLSLLKKDEEQKFDVHIVGSSWIAGHCKCSQKMTGTRLKRLMPLGMIGKALAYLDVVLLFGPRVGADLQVSCPKHPLCDENMIQSVDDESWG